MTPNQYIITEERLQLLYRVTKSIRVLGYSQKANMIEEVTDEVRSHPYNPQSEREKKIDYLRSLGWMVAVHNDYKQNGEFHTFWLLTYPDGKFLKGEGNTDDEALEQIVEQFRQEGERG